MAESPEFFQTASIMCSKMSQGFCRKVVLAVLVAVVLVVVVVVVVVVVDVVVIVWRSFCIFEGNKSKPGFVR